MKNTNTIRNRNWLFWVFALTLLPVFAHAKEQSAFDLIKEGNRYVGEQAKDRVVEIRSEKSVAGLVPNVWYVVYHDPTASLKAVEVKFGAGKMLDVKRPFRLLEPAIRKDLPLDREKLQVDSDRALKIALAEPLLEKLKITNAQFKLDRNREGLAVWRVRLWAEKLRRPQDTADIGQVILSAENGKVIESDLHINRID